MCTFLCVNVATLMPQHVLIVRGQPWMSVFTVHFIKIAFIFVVRHYMYWAGRDFLASDSHVTLGKLGLQTSTIMPDISRF